MEVPSDIIRKTVRVLDQFRYVAFAEAPQVLARLSKIRFHFGCSGLRNHATTEVRLFHLIFSQSCKALDHPSFCRTAEIQL